MKTLGIGIDIIDNKRIRTLINNRSFINRIFGKSEIKLSKKISNKTNYFAKRFAAKESLAKSLGTGFRNNLNFTDVEILNDNKGKPYYFITKKPHKSEALIIFTIPNKSDVRLQCLQLFCLYLCV